MTSLTFVVGICHVTSLLGAVVIVVLIAAVGVVVVGTVLLLMRVRAVRSVRACILERVLEPAAVFV